jgi:glutamyl/glutaminyl-tRNA synthetase
MNVQTRTPVAQGYTPQQMQANFNQQMAEAHQSADPRWAAKGLDRPGASRGAGRQYLAGIQSSQNLADGIAKAYGQNLALMRTALAEVPAAQWHAEHLLETLKAAADAHGLKLGDAMQPIRVALTGSTVSEPVNELLVVVGREPALERLTP